MCIAHRECSESGNNHSRYRSHSSPIEAANIAVAQFLRFGAIQRSGMFVTYDGFGINGGDRRLFGIEIAVTVFPAHQQRTGTHFAELAKMWRMLNKSDANAPADAFVRGRAVHHPGVVDRSFSG